MAVYLAPLNKKVWETTNDEIGQRLGNVIWSSVKFNFFLCVANGETTGLTAKYCSFCL